VYPARLADTGDKEVIATSSLYSVRRIISGLSKKIVWASRRTEYGTEKISAKTKDCSCNRCPMKNGLISAAGDVLESCGLWKSNHPRFLEGDVQ